MRTIKISIEIIETEEKVNKKVSLFEQIKNQVDSFKKEKEESMRTMVENVRQLNPISDKLLLELNEYVGLEFYKKSKFIQTITINNERKEVFSGLQLYIPSINNYSPWSGLYIGFKGVKRKTEHGEIIDYDYSEVKIYFKIDLERHKTYSGYIFDFDLGKINSICDPLYKSEIKRVLAE